MIVDGDNRKMKIRKHYFFDELEFIPTITDLWQDQYGRFYILKAEGVKDGYLISPKFYRLIAISLTTKETVIDKNAHVYCLPDRFIHDDCKYIKEKDKQGD